MNPAEVVPELESLLDYLRRIQPQSYADIIAKLGIRK